MEYSNHEIETALQNGDEKIFEALFRMYYSSLSRYAHNLLQDIDNAEEVVQQVFTTIWEKRSTVNIKVSFKSYLYRAVHNRCLNLISQTKVRQLYAEEKTIYAEPDAIVASEPILQNELRHLVAMAIEKLPEQCRNVFKLSRLEEMKYSEIAAHLGISVKTVENHMGKALRIMREELKDYLPQLGIIGTLIKFIQF